MVTAESFTPTTTRTPPSFNHFLARASAPAGMVADKKHFWTVGLVHAERMGSTWGRKSDERRRSDSSRMTYLVLKHINDCLFKDE